MKEITKKKKGLSLGLVTKRGDSTSFISNGKRILSLLLVVTFLISLLPVQAMGYDDMQNSLTEEISLGGEQENEKAGIGEALSIDKSVGIYDMSTSGFSIKMNGLPTELLTIDDFKIAAVIDNDSVNLEEADVTTSTSIEAVTEVKFNFNELQKGTTERKVKYSVQYRDGDVITNEYICPASDNWIDYAANKYAEGDGTSGNPYQISTAEELALFSQNPDTYTGKYFILTNNIDMSGKNWTPKNFNGYFDGQNYSISNIKVVQGSEAGFFGKINGTRGVPNVPIAYVSNLRLVNCNIGSEDNLTISYAGVLVGSAKDVCITNCSAEGGSVYGKYVSGGLVGDYCCSDTLGNVVISRCFSTAIVGSIKGNSKSGGLIGHFADYTGNYGTVEVNDCWSGGSVTGVQLAGGLIGSVGRIKGVTINHCYSTGTVISGIPHVGGLVGLGDTSKFDPLGPDGLTICNSAALNLSLFSKKDKEPIAGCIVANGDDLRTKVKGKIVNSYGIDTMTVNGTALNENYGNGTAVSATTVESKSFWDETLNFDFSQNGNWIWNEAKHIPEINYNNKFAIKHVITAQPRNATVYSNHPAVLGVVVSGGTMNYTYQWEHSADKQQWTNISGANNSCFKVLSTDGYTNNTYFRCSVTDESECVVISDIAEITISDETFNIDKAVSELKDYYKHKGITTSKEAIGLHTVMKDISQLNVNLSTYNDYYPSDLSSKRHGNFPWLLIDCMPLGLDPLHYSVTGSGPAMDTDVVKIFMNQLDKNGQLYANWYAFLDDKGYDAPAMTIALDSYYGGATKWGNEKDGTKLGRDGAIEYLMNKLEDNDSARSYGYINEDNPNYPWNYSQTAQSMFVIMMARLSNDTKWAADAKAAIKDVMSTLENTEMSRTECVARYVSALVAASNVSEDSSIKESYINRAESIIKDKLLPTKAVDGGYGSVVNETVLVGDEDATAAVIMALGDYANKTSILATYNYSMSDSTCVANDLAAVSIPDLAVENLSLGAVGKYGSTLTWTSSDEKIIDPKTGAITRGDKNVTVRLTVVVTKGNIKLTKNFSVEIKANTDINTDAVDIALASVSIPIETISNIKLPNPTVDGVNFEWSTSDASVIAKDGTVNRPQKGNKDAKISMTVTAISGDVKKTKTFEVIVYAQTEDSLKEGYYVTRIKYLNNRDIYGYWNVWAAYSVLGDYIQDPANGFTFTLSMPKPDWYGTQYGAQVLAICAMGENPYNYNGTDWVELLKQNSGGGWGAPIYSLLGMEAAGAPKNIYTCNGNAAIGMTKPENMTMGIDLAGWAAVALAQHKGEEGIDQAISNYLNYLKDKNKTGKDGSLNSNFISTGCAVVGFSALLGADVEDCDPTKAPWLNNETGIGPVDCIVNTALTNPKGKDYIPGYDAQIEMAVGDLYSVKYNNSSTAWLSCGVSKAKLDAQIIKANKILAEKDMYQKDNIVTLEKALDEVNKISTERLEAKIPDFGKEYFNLYDAVRHISGGINAIKITNPPKKVTYDAGEFFDPAGMVITAIYPDGKEAAVEGYTYTPVKALTVDNKNVVITYMGKSTSQPITVKEVGNIPVPGEVCTAYVSVEKFVLGQGYIFEPMEVSFVKGASAADVIMDAIGKSNCRAIESSFGFYLEAVKDKEKPVILPDYLKPYVKTLCSRSDSNWLGEKDYTNTSGWMITVNNEFIPVSAGNWKLENGDVMRWQYTLYGLGGDLGNNTMGSAGIIKVANKDDLTRKVAKIRSKYNDSVLLSNGDYASVMKVLTNPAATQKEVNQASSSLSKINFNNSVVNNPIDKQNSGLIVPKTILDSKGHATAVITYEDFDAAVKKTIANNSSTIYISPTDDKEATKITIEFPKKAISEIINEAKIELSIKTNLGNMIISNKGLKKLEKHTGDKVTISFDKKSDDTFDIIVAINENKIKSVEGGIKVSIPCSNLEPNSVLLLEQENGIKTIVKKSAINGNNIDALLFGTCNIKIVTNKKNFEDVSEGFWGKEAIDFVTGHELFMGTDNKEFGPNEYMTRAMLVTVLHRIEGYPNSEKSKFDDVELNTWYTDSVSWATNVGIVNGTGMGFEPNGHITREQLVTMLYRYVHKTGFDISDKKGDISKFTDVSEVSSWAKDSMEWAVGLGLIEGKDNNIIDATGQATRSEVAAVLQRYITNLVK